MATVKRSLTRFETPGYSRQQNSKLSIYRMKKTHKVKNKPKRHAWDSSSPLPTLKSHKFHKELSPLRNACFGKKKGSACRVTFSQQKGSLTGSIEKTLGTEQAPKLCKNKSQASMTGLLRKNKGRDLKDLYGSKTGKKLKKIINSKLEIRKKTCRYEIIRSLKREESANNTSANFSSQRKGITTCDTGTNPERTLKCEKCLSKNQLSKTFCSCDSSLSLDYYSQSDPNITYKQIFSLCDQLELNKKLGLEEVTCRISQVKEIFLDCATIIQDLIRKYDEEQERQKERSQSILVTKSKEILKLTKTVSDLTQSNDSLKKRIEVMKSTISRSESSISLKRVNEELEDRIKELTAKIKYVRQRENKVLYLFYCAQEQGIPLQDLYEDKIKNIPTERFDGMINSEASQVEISHKNFQNEYEVVYDSVDAFSSAPSVSCEASYEPIATGKPKEVKKPECIKTLNFDGLSAYQVSPTEQNSNKTKEFSDFLKGDFFVNMKSLSRFGDGKNENGSHQKMPSIIAPECDFNINITNVSK
ncbi:unnamed protein product [Moneuplotes crassus]|uniref:Uncharacterized protein n=1 Tax=Euplotes crassus TaxID=5936 RepID=A0AAD1YDQ2_EUPCR|nr:unnamed protein product [Moneuplotes crassus]